jgi:hypothetical protein
LAGGKVPEALALLDEMAASDPEAARLRDEIRQTYHAYGLAYHTEAADRAEREGDYATAAEHLAQAEESLQGPDRQAMQARREALLARAAETSGRVGPALETLAEMAGAPAEKIASDMDKLLDAVDMVLAVGGPSQWTQAGESLAKALGTVDTAVQAAAAALKDPNALPGQEAEALLEAQSLLRQQAQRVSDALAEPAAPATASAPAG